MISVSGGGVHPDQPLIPGGPLPEGYRFRVSPTADSREDFDVFFADGRLHVVGHYGTVHAERIEPNHVSLHVVRPGH